MAFITKAKYVFDVNSQTDIVEVDYVKYVEGNGWKSCKDWIYTYPEGDWVDMNFGKRSSVEYVDFLNTMVFKNLDVHRKMAKLSIDHVSTKNPKRLLKIMNAIRILDPTFIPPEINTDCQWQIGLLKHIAFTTSYEVIAGCKDKKRLHKYFRVFQLI